MITCPFLFSVDAVDSGQSYAIALTRTAVCSAVWPMHIYWRPFQKSIVCQFVCLPARKYCSLFEHVGIVCMTSPQNFALVFVCHASCCQGSSKLFGAT